jgi:putative flippase GtrA
MYAQLGRYFVAGATSAAVYALVYLLVADRFLPPGQAAFAVVPAFLVSLYVSFQLHSRWSFAGHGSRDEKVAQPLRFFAVQAVGLAINFVMTYVVTAVLLAPNWVALVPSLTLTPLLTFALQRYWVFR